MVIQMYTESDKPVGEPLWRIANNTDNGTEENIQRIIGPQRYFDITNSFS